MSLPDNSGKPSPSQDSVPSGSSEQKKRKRRRRSWYHRLTKYIEENELFDRVVIIIVVIIAAIVLGLLIAQYGLPGQRRPMDMTTPADDRRIALSVKSDCCHATSLGVGWIVM